ncbi:hypothetical protein ACVW27_001479 [Klebsiella pneumoniae]
MKNTIQDLMNHQFAMLETVTDPNIKGDLLQEELSRAKAVVEIVGVMVGTYRVALDAQKAIYDGTAGNVPKEGANKQVISSQADSLIKISRIWADFFPANTSNQPI